MKKFIKIMIICMCISFIPFLIGCSKEKKDTPTDNDLSGITTADELLLNLKKEAKTDLDKYYEDNKLSITIENQIQMLNENKASKDLIDSAKTSKEISNEKQKGIYKLDLIILLDTHNKTLEAIDLYYDEDLETCLSVINSISPYDIFEGSEAEYKAELSEYNKQLQTLAIQKDLTLAEYKKLYANSPGTYEVSVYQLEKQYQASRKKVQNQIDNLEQKWQNKVNYEQAVYLYNYISALKSQDIEIEENTYNQEKLEIELKIASLQ